MTRIKVLFYDYVAEEYVYLYEDYFGQRFMAISQFGFRTKLDKDEWSQ